MILSSALLFHGDLDGLYSALSYYRSRMNEADVDGVLSVEYGQEHPGLVNKYDMFYIFDYADNPCGSKTMLLVDHHLHQAPTGAQQEIIGKSPSCVSLLRDKGLLALDLISDEDVACIDAVDSGDYKWSDVFTKEDLLLPEPKNQLCKFVILNQLLRKNRKHGLSERLFAGGSLKVDVSLYEIENDRGIKTVKYNTYIQNKQKLIEKLMVDREKYVKKFSGIPVLFTKEFTQEDWKGYDLNIIGYLEEEAPFFVLVFDMGGKVNLQIVRNVFYKGAPKKPILEILGDSIDSPRGHENILNFTYANGDEASLKLDAMLNKLTAEL